VIWRFSLTLIRYIPYNFGVLYRQGKLGAGDFEQDAGAGDFEQDAGAL